MKWFFGIFGIRFWFDRKEGEICIFVGYFWIIVFLFLIVYGIKTS